MIAKKRTNIKIIIIILILFIDLFTQEFIISSKTQTKNAEVTFDVINLSRSMSLNNEKYIKRCAKKIIFKKSLEFTVNKHKEYILNCIKYTKVHINNKNVVFSNELLLSTSTLSILSNRFSAKKTKDIVMIYY